MMKNIFDIKGRTALITGAAGLIGSRFVDVLLNAGSNVVAADSNYDRIDNKKEQDNYLSAQVDITKEISIRTTVENTIKKFGKLDIFIHCAALDPKFDESEKDNHISKFEDYPADIWKKAIDINLTGAFLCVKEVIKPMLEQNSGSMILLSSIYGLVAPDQRVYETSKGQKLYKPPYYSVSKAGIIGLVRYVAAYYAGKGFRINALSPGGVYNKHDDEFVDQYASRTVLGRMADISELDGAILFLSSSASSYMTGSNLIIDGGWTTW